jgi:hypothetical protein
MVHKMLINLLAKSPLDRAISNFITMHSDGSWWWDYLWPIVSAWIIRVVGGISTCFVDTTVVSLL